MVLIWMGLAHAQSLDPFVGTWAFDASASESIGPLLAAQGISWPLRALATAARPTLEVSIDQGGLHIATLDSRGRRSDHVIPDGTSRASDSRTGPVSCASIWADTALQTDCTLSGGTLRVTRQADQDVWTQRITFTPADGPAVVVTRVFRR